jgi:dipeptidyl-peptidase-4
VKPLVLFITAALIFIPLAVAQKALTIEAIFAEGGITGRGPETINWSPDNARFTYIQRDDSGEHGVLWIVDAASGRKKILVSDAGLAQLSPSLNRIQDEREKEWLIRYHVAAYSWSPDSRYLLFNARGRLWLYTLENDTAVQFSFSPDASVDPKFSPDGARIAYVRKHNLYVSPVSGGDGERQLTRDKDENLLNGEVDWVYAEELDVRSNYFWSPDGSQIVFLQMNETKVPTYPIVNWMPTHPEVDREEYPKAGDPNPVVRLGVVDSLGREARWITPTEESDVYIPRFGWVSDGVLWAQVLNRLQNRLDLYFIDSHTGSARKVLTEANPDGWVNVNDDFNVLRSKDRFLWTSWRDGHTHIYLYSFDKLEPLAADAKLERQITRGEFEVLRIDAVDNDAGLIYFTCNRDDPRQMQLYSVKLDGSGFRRVSREDGTHTATFSGDARYYVDESSATLTPPHMSICDAKGSCQEVWKSHSVDEYGLVAPRQLEFHANDGTKLYGRLQLPAENTSARIPLLVYVYGGPAEQVVRDSWIGTIGLFHQRLAQEGFAIFTVDNRGTPNRDRKFQTAIRHQFGGVELKDQLAALDQLLAEYPQLDPERIAIWGWSNGGSMTLYSMTHSDRFKAGVSIAPVTDWHDYDSIYTERYMGLPSDNPGPYIQSISSAAASLHGALLLVHGTSDDNVHLQNSIQMVDALIKSGKQFGFMVYPGKTHSISGALSRTHLFHMIEDHLERQLK